MTCSRNMNEFEVEHENTFNPAIDSSVRLKIGFVEHALDVLRIHLYPEMSDSIQEEAIMTERSEKSVEFEFRLTIV